MGKEPTKERPILFNGEMVRAILAGRKTQTRRVVKLTESGRVKEVGSSRNWHLDDPNAVLACPYGRVGDRLWVRETFVEGYEVDDSGYLITMDEDENELDPRVWYRADDNPGLQGWLDEEGFMAENIPWKPSIHMPRSACRLVLEVTDVRIERVASISDEDAYREGVEMIKGPREPEYGVPGLAPTFKHYQNPEFNGGRGVGVHHSFQTLWDSINAKRGFGFEANPWVWAVSFKVIGPQPTNPHQQDSADAGKEME